MEASKTMAGAAAESWSKGLTDKNWETISNVAVPLKVGAAMAAEVLGVCVLTSVLDLILCKNPECTEHQSTNKPDLSLFTDHAFWPSVTSESQCGSVPVDDAAGDRWRKTRLWLALRIFVCIWAIRSFPIGGVTVKKFEACSGWRTRKGWLTIIPLDQAPRHW